MADRLLYLEVATGRVLDTLTFNEGQLAYDTGRARPAVEARHRLAVAAPRVALRTLDGWSNGYVRFAPPEAVAAERVASIGQRMSSDYEVEVLREP